MTRASSMDIRITISTLGKFVLFYLAQELDRKDRLERLLTNLYSEKWPGLRILRRDTEHISPERCALFPLVELFRGARYLPRVEWRERAELAQADAFDAWASRRLGAADVVLARSIVAEKTVKRAKAMGKRSVLFRGSAHIQTQYELLEEEHRRFGLHVSLNRRLMEKELREYKLVDAVYVLSSFSKKTFLDRGMPSQRLIVSPPGVDPQVFYPDSRKKKFKVLFAGGIGLEKGIPYLLEATKRLRLKREDVVLVGAMDPQVNEWLRKSGFAFTHLPPCAQPRLREMYASSEVFVLPSIQDGFGVVMLEAMACGCPVVATTHTGGPDIIRDGQNGFLIPPRNAEALADRIERILVGAAGRQRMSREAIRTATRFSWKRSADRIESACGRLSEAKA